MVRNCKRVNFFHSPQSLCRKAWEDFNIACDQGRAIEWLELDPEEDDLKLYMLDRYLEMRKENQELKLKIALLLSILEE